MKYIIPAFLFLALTGCAGLNVSWVATATYNAQAQTITNITPGVKP